MPLAPLPDLPPGMGPRMGPLIPTEGAAGAKLPCHTNRLIGRQGDMDAISAILGGSGVRLLTLTGPGGVGKTRLAIAVAAWLAPNFVTGAAFVELVPVRDPGLVLPTIARALGARLLPGAPAVESLAELLHDRHCLLVLDNLEQVIEAASELAALLSACPELTLLVTSRARLRLTMEHVYPVAPLPVPGPEDPTNGPVADNPAVALFIQRARQVVPGFALNTGNQEAVAAICRRLDGLPLAIELAAARVPVLSPGELLTRLDQRLNVLTGGARDLPHRHQTMVDAVAWSYDILGPGEQVLLRRLSVYLGGWTIEAAESLSAHLDNAAGDIFEVLASLVEKHLVHRLPDIEGLESRFAMLETIRAFGLEQLRTRGEEVAVRTAHAAFFTDLAESMEPDLYEGRDLHRLLGTLEAEHPNMRAALTHLLGSGDATAGLRLAGALAPFWLFRSYRGEGRRWLERALLAAAGLEVAPEVRAQALGGAAVLASGQGDHERAETLAQAELLIREELGDAWGAASAMNVLGAIARGRGDYDRAATSFEQALIGFQNVEDAGRIALARCNLGILAYWRGDLDRARTSLGQAVAFYREAGNRYPAAAAAALSDLALVTCADGDLTGAATLFNESLGQWRLAGTKEGLADWLARVAILAQARDRAADAAVLLGAAEGVGRAIGYHFELPERRRHEQSLAAIRSTIGEARLSLARETGAALSLDQAINAGIAVTGDTRSLINTSPRGDGAAAGLTPRERQVLRLVAEGCSDREIAASLFISPRTVGGHVTSILGKLGVSSRAAATAYAIRQGLS